MPKSARIAPRLRRNSARNSRPTKSSRLRPRRTAAKCKASRVWCQPPTQIPRAHWLATRCPARFLMGPLCSPLPSYTCPLVHTFGKGASARRGSRICLLSSAFCQTWQRAGSHHEACLNAIADCWTLFLDAHHMKKSQCPIKDLFDGSPALQASDLLWVRSRALVSR